MLQLEMRNYKILEKLSNQRFIPIEYSYNNKSFGNTLIKVEYKNIIVISYRTDKGQPIARIRYYKDEFFVEDFFDALNIDYSVNDKDYESMISDVNSTLIQNYTNIEATFKEYDDEIVKRIKSKIDERINKLLGNI